MPKEVGYLSYRSSLLPRNPNFLCYLKRLIPWQSREIRSMIITQTWILKYLRARNPPMKRPKTNTEVKAFKRVMLAACWCPSEMFRFVQRASRFHCCTQTGLRTSPREEKSSPLWPHWNMTPWLAEIWQLIGYKSGSIFFFVWLLHEARGARDDKKCERKRTK